ncbi:hypothetical protein U9M48_039970 [Paspalum notatum var. saurae]|uniref:Uncharacterized protein n=1 Tax=Paspalum notatum var. saurae TaxID=547442 RepID=A0AAQ3UPE4_PASNO
MTGHHKWFSSLNPMSTKEYITFGDNGQGKVLGVGSVSLSAKLSLREVAFVWNIGFNLVSVSQLLNEGFEVCFKKGACRVLDAEETLVCSLLPFGQVLRVDLTSVSGPARCLVASLFADIWKWNRRLGHLSFDVLVRLSSMGLIRGLPKLRAEKDLVRHPCRHGKMVAASHIPVSQVMTSYSERVVERKNRTLVEMARMMLDEHRTPRHFWTEVVNMACYIANWIFLRAFLGKTSYELRFGRQPSVKHLRAFGCRCFVLKKAGHLDKFESRCLDGIFLGYASSSRAFRVWILETKQVGETCEVSFDETMPCTTLAFELSGDDEEGTPIFEDEEGADNVGDAGATAPATALAPSATSFDDDGGPLPMASSSVPRQQAQAEAGRADDAGKVTSEIVQSQQVQRDHPPHRMIGDIHQRVTRSTVASLAFFSHSAYVATFEPQDVSHALSDPNWVNAMHEELENFERNHVWDLVELSPNCRPIANGCQICFPERVHRGGGQPPSFESATFPDWVYKLRKALYGLKQAPRAWYARLKSFQLKSGFVMGSVDKTLFLLSRGGDTLIVQIYVDDIIFGGSSHALVSSFAKQMSREFEMSIMGELQFFLKLQIKQGLCGGTSLLNPD